MFRSALRGGRRDAGVAAGGVNPLAHYLMFGIYEGRQAVNDGLWH